MCSVEGIRPIQGHVECSLCVIYDGIFNRPGLTARNSAKVSAIHNLRKGLGVAIVRSWSVELRMGLRPFNIPGFTSADWDEIDEILMLR